jgi:hypothetical protein
MIFPIFKTKKPILFLENGSLILHTPPLRISPTDSIVVVVYAAKFMENKTLLTTYARLLITEK